MSKLFRLFMILVLAGLCVPPGPVQAAGPLPADKTQCEAALGVYGSTPDGSNFCLWLPAAPYAGDLLIFAHGYTDPLLADGSIPWEQLAMTTPTLPALVTGQLKAAFAITSYAHNGLAVKEGVTAVTQLAAALKSYPGVTIKNIYLVGASEGGLVAALALEQNPGEIFKGGVSACGPIGDFQAQINYWGDFRVVFDYYFQEFRADLANPTWITSATRTTWGALDPTQPLGPLQAKIVATLTARPAATAALLVVSKAPVDPLSLSSVATTVLGLLDYNVRATNQARMELSGNPALDGSTNDGNPFGNYGRKYQGSGDISDYLMNEWIRANDSFVADPLALAAVQAGYQTSGKIATASLVVLHTAGDPIVPYWQAPLYQKKVWFAGNAGRFYTIPVARYGHCTFTAKEMVFAYVMAVQKATGVLPTLPEEAGGDPSVLTRMDYLTMRQQYDPFNRQPFYIPLIQN